MDRIKFLKFSFLIFALLVVLRLFFLQVIRKDHYTALAEGQHWLRRQIPAKRGRIFSADGFPLATNTNAYLVYAVPPKVKDIKQTAVEVAKVIVDPSESGTSGSNDAPLSKEELIDKKAEELEKLMSVKGRFWVPLAHKLSSEKTDNLKALNLAGIYLEQEEKRVYPEGSLAAHVLGFVGKNNSGEDQGYFGIEGYYNRELSGRAGFASLEKDASGKPIPVGDKQVLKAQDGRDLHLTIDRGLQYFLERKLAEGVKKYRAQNGTVILMEPQTGKILSMANYPNFEPEYWTKFLGDEVDVSKVETFRNIAVQDSYEPGSVLKALTMSAALEEKVITPQTTYDDSGPKAYSGYLIRTWNNNYHGVIDIARILQLSSNTGAAWVGTQIGFTRYAKYLKKFHLGEVTGVDLQGEASGIVRDKSEWRDIDLANMSFGQGIGLTPLQLVSILATIADDGTLMKPYLVEKISEPNSKGTGKPKEVRVEPQVLGKPISPQTAKTMQILLRGVVEKGEFKWFVKQAGLDKFPVAGKTGTAQIPEGGRYINKTQVTFVGFTPIENPKFVMLVKLARPTTSTYSAETAVPLWLEMAKGLMLHFGIGPEK